MESDDLRVRYSPARGQRRECRQPFDDRVRQLMSSNLQEDTLELFRSNEAVLVLVEVMERLSQPLALKPLHKLRELVVCHPQQLASGVPNIKKKRITRTPENVRPVLLPQIQPHPIAIEIERDGARADVRVEDALELVEVDRPALVRVEVLERDQVVRVGALEEGLEDGEVVPGDEPALVRVRHAEEDGVLGSGDLGGLAGGGDGVDEVVRVQEPRSSDVSPNISRVSVFI